MQKESLIKAPGKHHRKGMTLIVLHDRFPDEESARCWFEEAIWQGQRYCGHCGSINTNRVPKDKPMPYWCSDCRNYFSVKTGTPMQSSKIPLRKWAIGLYLMTTSLKGVSSLKLHRDLGISQGCAWHMGHRIREALQFQYAHLYGGPVEVDETYIGGLEKNKHTSKRLRKGRGTVGKTAVVGVKDRETGRVSVEVAESTDKETLQGVIKKSTRRGDRGQGIHG